MRKFEYTYPTDEGEKLQETTGTFPEGDEYLTTSICFVELSEVVAIYFKTKYKGKDRCAIILKCGDCFNIVENIETMAGFVEEAKQQKFLMN